MIEHIFISRLSTYNNDTQNIEYKYVGDIRISGDETKRIDIEIPDDIQLEVLKLLNPYIHKSLNNIKEKIDEIIQE